MARPGPSDTPMVVAAQLGICRTPVWTIWLFVPCNGCEIWNLNGQVDLGWTVLALQRVFHLYGYTLYTVYISHYLIQAMIHIGNNVLYIIVHIPVFSVS